VFTVFGIATSLGFGAAQISGGISYLFKGIENNFTTQITIILIVTVLFMLSAHTIFGTLWFFVFGGSAIYLDYLQNISIVDIVNEQGKEDFGTHYSLQD
jgi:choline-glycine betaine transporter